MDPNTFPTKGNLILAKNALALSRQGFDLMDKKRNILIRELMELITEASDIQSQIDETFSNAYQALQKANIQMGIHQVEQIAKAVPVENSIRNKRRSVMGTEIPKVEYEKNKQTPAYSFYHTRMSLDEACQQFEKVKELTIRLAEVENSAYRLDITTEQEEKALETLEDENQSMFDCDIWMPVEMESYKQGENFLWASSSCRSE